MNPTSDYAPGGASNSGDRGVFAAPCEEVDVRRLAALGLMTTGIAHDIGNLLQIVASAIHLIEHSLDPAENVTIHPFTQGAMAAVDRAAALSRQILRYSRSSTIGEEVTEIDVALAAIENLICWTTGPAIQVELSLGGDLPPVICNVREFENAILNLVINARDAMPDGGRLTLSTYREVAVVDESGVPAGGDPVAVLCVTDTGHGMSSETARQAFKPFFSTKPADANNGLGLAIVSDFVRRLGGSVHIESLPGMGASINLRLPGCREPATP